jgi:hypothetical protein
MVAVDQLKENVREFSIYMKDHEELTTDFTYKEL